MTLLCLLQVDIMRPWQQVLESVDYMVAMVIRRGLMSLEVGIQDTEFLLQTWGLFCHWLKEEGLQRSGGSVNSEALNKLEVIILLLQKLNTKLKVFTGGDHSQHDVPPPTPWLAQLGDIVCVCVCVMVSSRHVQAADGLHAAEGASGSAGGRLDQRRL